MPTAAQVKRRFTGLDRQHIAVAVWCAQDVIDRGKERHIHIGLKQANAIIDEIDHHQDCSLGITWDTLDCYIDELFQDGHQRAREQKKS